MSRNNINLTDLEVAAILAGLRLVQAQDALPKELTDHLNVEQFERLDIDALCERVNHGIAATQEPEDNMLHCPACNEINVVHQETVWKQRTVEGFDEDGVLVIEAYAKELDDSAHDDTLYCRNCEHEWWPKGVEVDYR